MIIYLQKRMIGSILLAHHANCQHVNVKWVKALRRPTDCSSCRHIVSMTYDPEPTTANPLEIRSRRSRFKAWK